MQPGSGRQPRLTAAERRAVIVLVARPPPSRRVRSPAGTLAPDDRQRGAVSEWSLLMHWRRPPTRTASRSDAATSAGRAPPQGRTAAPRGRTAAPRGRTAAPRTRAPHGRRSSPGTRPAPPPRPQARRPAAATTAGPLVPRTFPPAPSWPRRGQRIQAPMEEGRGDQQVWGYGALRVHAGQEVTFTSALLRAPPGATSRGAHAAGHRHAHGRAHPGQQPPLQPQQRADPGVGGAASTGPPRPRPHRCLLAQAAGRRVAALPARSLRRPVLRRGPRRAPGRHRWPRSISMRGPSRGSGAVHLHHSARFGAPLSATFEE
jgi:hypothetical protein